MEKELLDYLNKRGIHPYDMLGQTIYIVEAEVNEKNGKLQGKFGESIIDAVGKDRIYTFVTNVYDIYKQVETLSYVFEDFNVHWFFDRDLANKKIGEEFFKDVRNI